MYGEERKQDVDREGNCYIWLRILPPDFQHRIVEFRTIDSEPGGSVIC